MEVRLHPAARQELIDAADWYAAQAGQRVAHDFVADYDEAHSRLVENPRIGALGTTQTRMLMLRRFPFVLVYRLVADHLLIVAVAHRRRRPGYWRKRE
jgi:plasmid stabilization system protein ParE